MKIILCIILMICSYIIGYERGINISSQTMSELICKSKTIEELKKHIKDHNI